MIKSSFYLFQYSGIKNALIPFLLLALPFFFYKTHAFKSVTVAQKPHGQPPPNFQKALRPLRINDVDDLVLIQINFPRCCRLAEVRFRLLACFFLKKTPLLNHAKI